MRCTRDPSTVRREYRAWRWAGHSMLRGRTTNQASWLFRIAFQLCRQARCYTLSWFGARTNGWAGRWPPVSANDVARHATIQSSLKTGALLAGNPKKALAHFEKAHKLKPDDPQALQCARPPHVHAITRRRSVDFCGHAGTRTHSLLHPCTTCARKRAHARDSVCARTRLTRTRLSVRTHAAQYARTRAHARTHARTHARMQTHALARAHTHRRLRTDGRICALAQACTHAHASIQARTQTTSSDRRKIGEILLAQGQSEAAKARLLAALEIDPTSTSAWTLLSKVNGSTLAMLSVASGVHLPYNAHLSYNAHLACSTPVRQRTPAIQRTPVIHPVI
jgi:tetratricopeptide (TPR) repeat protein